MTYDFTYTKEASDAASSLVEGIFYNENDQTMVVDLNDSLYQYTGISEQVFSDFVAADSLGAHYNTVVKVNYGPADYLGNYDDLDWNRVAVNTKPTADVTSNDWTYSSDSINTTITAGPGQIYIANPPTQEVSLATPEVPSNPATGGIDDSVVEATFKVHFTLVGHDKKYKFDAESANSVEAAIDELNAYVSRLGARGVVSKVVVKFD